MTNKHFSGIIALAEIAKEDTDVIDVNDFPQFGGLVKSLGYTPPGSNKRSLSIGITKPGRHVFKPHTRDEHIQVTSGKIVVNGKEIVPFDGGHFFPAGGEIVFEVEEVSTYLCRFPK